MYRVREMCDVCPCRCVCICMCVRMKDTYVNFRCAPVCVYGGLVGGTACVRTIPALTLWISEGWTRA